MKNVDDVCVIVQARMGSKRLKRKMLKPFSGTTLMDICLQKLSSCKVPNKNIWVSVHEKELVDVCSKYPVNIFRRSQKSATSEGTPMSEMYEWWNKIPYKYVVLVNACAPFLKANTIESFYYDYCKSKSDGMFGVIEKKNYFWNSDNILLTPLKEDVMNTKTAEVIKEAAHCLYASKLQSIDDGIWMGDFNKHNEIELWTMSEDEVLDIDYKWQFDMFERAFQPRGLYD